MPLPADAVGPDASLERSVDPCPVCGHHDLTLDLPPHLPVAGVQPYTDVIAMGDLPMPAGVHCASCGTRWVSIEALRAGEPSPPDVEPPADLVVEDGADVDEGDHREGDARALRQRRWARSPDLVDMVTLVVAAAAGMLLLASGVLWLAMIPVIALLLLVRRRAQGRSR